MQPFAVSKLSMSKESGKEKECGERREHLHSVIEFEEQWQWKPFAKIHMLFLFLPFLTVFLPAAAIDYCMQSFLPIVYTQAQAAC